MNNKELLAYLRANASTRIPRRDLQAAPDGINTFLQFTRPRILNIMADHAHGDSFAITSHQQLWLMLDCSIDGKVSVLSTPCFQSLPASELDQYITDDKVINNICWLLPWCIKALRAAMLYGHVGNLYSEYCQHIDMIARVNTLTTWLSIVDMPKHVLAHLGTTTWDGAYPALAKQLAETMADPAEERISKFTVLEGKSI